MSNNPVVWDPKSPRQSLKYAITWHIRRTGHLPAQVAVPGAVEVEEAAAKALAAEMKSLGVAVHVDDDALGIVCKGQGKAVELHQLPWRPLYHDGFD